MAEAPFAASRSKSHASTLCKSCEDKMFSKEAWRRYWAQKGTPRHRYVVTHKELLAGKSSGCWFCRYMCDRNGLPRTIDLLVEFISPEKVEPRKIHAMQITWRDCETQEGRIERWGVSTGVGESILRLRLHNICGSHNDQIIRHP